MANKKELAVRTVKYAEIIARGAEQSGLSESELINASDIIKKSTLSFTDEIREEKKSAIVNHMFGALRNDLIPAGKMTSLVTGEEVDVPEHWEVRAGVSREYVELINADVDRAALPDMSTLKAVA